MTEAIDIVFPSAKAAANRGSRTNGAANWPCIFNRHIIAEDVTACAGKAGPSGAPWSVVLLLHEIRNILFSKTAHGSTGKGCWAGPPVSSVWLRKTS